jgi:hypothetical protein
MRLKVWFINLSWGKSFSNCEPVKSNKLKASKIHINKLCASKVQLWDRHCTDISIPKGRSKREKDSRSQLNLKLNRKTLNFEFWEYSLTPYPVFQKHRGGSWIPRGAASMALLGLVHTAVLLDFILFHAKDWARVSCMLYKLCTASPPLS